VELGAVILDKILLGAVAALGLALSGLWIYDRTIYARHVYQSGIAAEKQKEAARIAAANAAIRAAEDLAEAAREIRLSRDAVLLASFRLPPQGCADTPSDVRAKLDCIGGGKGGAACAP
jgi:hypothetical protein